MSISQCAHISSNDGYHNAGISVAFQVFTCN